MSDRQDRLHLMATGYVEAKILLAGVELGVFDHLRGDGTSASFVAERIGGTLRGTEILLDALTAAEIIDKRDALYRNRPEYEDRLVSDGTSHYASLLRHRNRLFRRWAFLEETIRSDEALPEALCFSPRDDPRTNRDFIRAMVAVSGDRAAEIVAEIDLDGVRVVADLGGGPAHYLAEFLKRKPEIDPYLCDLPLTLEVARSLHDGLPLGEKGHFIVWDLYSDAPPEELPPVDLAFVSQVLHGESPEANRAFLARLFERMAPGGRVVIHENIVDPGRTTPRESALFAVNMLAMTCGGRTYTEAELHAWGTDAGFTPLPGRRIDARSFLVVLARPL